MSRPFSVLVYCTQHMPTGGIESHLQEFCRRLSEDGIEIDLIVLNAVMLPETISHFRKICRNVYFGNQGKSFMRLLWLFFIKIKLHNRRYDAIYTNGQGGTISLSAKLFSRGSKWVHHHHTSGDAADQSTWGNGYRRALASADVVIACSTRNALDIMTKVNRPVQTIPCFSRDIRKDSNFPTGIKLRFGYYGRLIPEKGIDLLCRLSKDRDLQNIEFHIWGKGDAYPDHFFSAFPDIHYHGPFSGELELSSVIESLDAYLLFSTHPEGLPIALLEVMSAGIPWLASDRGGIPDIVSDPMATRIIPSSLSYEEIKSEVLDLEDAIKKGKINRNTQRNFYEKKFSYKVLVKKWSEVLGLSLEDRSTYLAKHVS